MATIKQLAPTERSIEWLNRQDQWPKWPLCPLRHQDNRLAVLIVVQLKSDTDSLLVVETNMYELDLTAKQTIFDTVEDIVAAGWLVD